MPRSDDFTVRHIGSNPDRIEEMLQILGVDSLDDLIQETIPESIQSAEEFSLPRSLDENR